jgi:4-hydroxy-tetrahydrodipicolinate reductase
VSQAPLRIAVIGARGKLGSFACELVGRTPGLELVASFGQSDDWRGELAHSRAAVALESTRAGFGFDHGVALLERGVRPLIATSGVTPEQSDELDRRARQLSLGGIVVPNFSIGALLLQRFCEQAARWFDGAEIFEMHHVRKADAPSGTAAETARRIAAARRAGGLPPFKPATPGFSARGAIRDGVPVHSVRLAGLYAHEEVLFGATGESLTLRHDMSGPEAFAPGLLLALRHAATASGVAHGLEHALASHSRRP